MLGKQGAMGGHIQQYKPAWQPCSVIAVQPLLPRRSVPVCGGELWWVGGAVVDLLN